MRCEVDRLDSWPDVRLTPHRSVVPEMLGGVGLDADLPDIDAHRLIKWKK